MRCGFVKLAKQAQQAHGMNAGVGAFQLERDRGTLWVGRAGDGGNRFLQKPRKNKFLAKARRSQRKTHGRSACNICGLWFVGGCPMMTVTP
jgi:hypothetical protein